MSRSIYAVPPNPMRSMPGGPIEIPEGSRCGFYFEGVLGGLISALEPRHYEDRRPARGNATAQVKAVLN